MVEQFSTTTARPSTAGWADSAIKTKRHTDRNQQLDAAQDETTDPEPGRCRSGCVAHPSDLGVWWDTAELGDVAGRGGQCEGLGRSHREGARA
jgi:hypothetical protein